jgi:hypothetical protein
LEVLNKKVVPSLGILEIKFVSSSDTESNIDTSIALKTSCGYSLEYNVATQKVVLSGRKLKGGKTLMKIE